MLRFTCGERKIWSSIKISQNIMTMIVANDLLKLNNVINTCLVKLNIIPYHAFLLKIYEYW